MKRRFDFRLERVLRVRETLEKSARGRWADAEALAIAAENEVAWLRDERHHARTELREELEAPLVEPRRLLVAEAAIDTLGGRIEQARLRAQTLRFQAQELQAAWRRSERDRESLERLREKDVAAHRALLEAQENAERDERAASKAQRPVKEGISASASTPGSSDEEGPPLSRPLSA